MIEDNVRALMAKDHSEVDVIFRELMKAFEEEDAGRAFRLLDFLWARLAVHIRAENLCLFPAILRTEAHEGSEEHAPCPEEVRGAISELRLDHDFFMRELAGAVNRMRPYALNPGDVFPPEELAAIRQLVAAVHARLEAHNRLEEEKVYGWPTLFLSAEERQRLVDDLKLQLENLPPRFQTSTDEPHAK